MSEEEFRGEGLLRLDFGGNWTVDELSNFLRSLRVAYGSVLSFQHAVEREDLHRLRDRWHGPGPVLVVTDQPFGRRRLLPKTDEREWTSALALDREPQLKGIHIASPGWLEAIGKLNPLAVIADFIKWWPNRDLERQKIENEVERGELENELLRNKLLSEQAQLRRELGYSKGEVRAMLAQEVARPLKELERFIEGKVVKADARALPAGEPQKKPKSKKTDDKSEPAGSDDGESDDEK